MRWAEIDFHKRVWTIPAERMKARLQHRVPLSRQAIYILENIRGLHDELVFLHPESSRSFPIWCWQVFCVKRKPSVTFRGELPQHMVFAQHSGTGVVNRGIRGIWRKGRSLIRWKIRLRRHIIVLIYWSSVYRWCRHGRIMWCLKLWINNSENVYCTIMIWYVIVAVVIKEPLLCQMYWADNYQIVRKAYFYKQGLLNNLLFIKTICLF